MARDSVVCGVWRCGRVEGDAVLLRAQGKMLGQGAFGSVYMAMKGDGEIIGAASPLTPPSSILHPLHPPSSILPLDLLGAMLGTDATGSMRWQL